MFDPFFPPHVRKVKISVPSVSPVALVSDFILGGGSFERPTLSLRLPTSYRLLFIDLKKAVLLVDRIRPWYESSLSSAVSPGDLEMFL